MSSNINFGLNVSVGMKKKRSSVRCRKKTLHGPTFSMLHFSMYLMFGIKLSELAFETAVYKNSHSPTLRDHKNKCLLQLRKNIEHIFKVI